MNKKYIDLAPQIASMHDQPLGTMRVVLGLLDEFASEHPDQIPGRTITRSERQDILNGAVLVSGYGDDWERGFNTGLVVSGTKVVPDPEPTDAEKMKEDLDEWQGDIKECVRLGLPHYLASQGWTKAGDDDH